ncbi:MAG TPA: hypothetical protein VI873_01165 [Candidatus Peribacteraceae bacterium]|nr:hypothetical protein [Candidatus Peribacteraceae bacterium]
MATLLAFRKDSVVENFFWAVLDEKIEQLIELTASWYVQASVFGLLGLSFFGIALYTLWDSHRNRSLL